jgi:hypothetical protein
VGGRHGDSLLQRLSYIVSFVFFARESLQFWRCVESLVGVVFLLFEADTKLETPLFTDERFCQ